MFEPHCKCMLSNTFAAFPFQTVWIHCSGCLRKYCTLQKSRILLNTREVLLPEAASCLCLFVPYFLSDPEYKRFLEIYNGDEEKLTSTPETLLEELEAKSKELVGKWCALSNYELHLKHHCILKKTNTNKTLKLKLFSTLKLKKPLLCWTSWRINR